MIGFFGDSFSKDSYYNQPGWPTLLANKVGMKFDNYAEHGTSIWYSYKKFLKYYKKYSHIVFTYSFMHRWHSLPDHLKQFHWVISENEFNFSSMSMDPVTKGEIKELIKTHKILFDEQLDQFIYQNVYNHVNNICRENNIKLINVHPFEDDKDNLMIELSNQIGISVIGLNQISREEGVDRHLLLNGDFRPCHLNADNNKIVADILSKSFDKNGILNLYERHDI